MASDPSIGDFGAQFRQAREARGVSLQEIAGVTKISARVLLAIENNDVSKLPGGIFSRAFVRAYAVELGLDPQAAVDRFTAAFPDESGVEQMPAVKEAEDIESFESGRRAATTVIQLVGLSLAVITMVMFALNAKSCRRTAPASSIPPAAVNAPASTAQPATAAPPVEQPPAAAADSQPPAEADPKAGAGEGASTPAAAPIDLVITPQAECRLVVKVDRDTVLERIVQPGERLAYRALASVALTTDNAAAVAWTLNGKPARSLGGSGKPAAVTVTAATLASFLQ